MVRGKDVGRISLAGRSSAVRPFAGRLILFNAHRRISEPHQLHFVALLRQYGGLLLPAGGALGFVVAGKGFAAIGNAHAFFFRGFGSLSTTVRQRTTCRQSPLIVSRRSVPPPASSTSTGRLAAAGSR